MFSRHAEKKPLKNTFLSLKYGPEKKVAKKYKIKRKIKILSK